MLMNSRKSFSPNISFSFSSKFKNVLQLAFIYLQYPNVCKLLQVLIATPCITSCVERGYSFLQLVCASRRNHLKTEHLETLFLLAALKLPVKNSKDFDDEIKLLEK